MTDSAFRPETSMGSLERLSSALADRYRIERELGAGGMATVYLAHDLRHGRDVAIKVLHPDLGAALGGERFLSEIRTTARLQHPHILPLLDSGIARPARDARPEQSEGALGSADGANGLPYYVMPYVAGETLRARLDRERQLPIDDAVRIAREIADALGHAHSVGIVHRDIKPENILLQSGHALVADFGIALAVQQAGGQRMTQTGLSLGTPQYMSPEQAMGEKSIDARSDIYALGAVTYEMLVGEPPFTGASIQAIVAKVLAERPTPPHTVRDTVPPSVEDAVLRALAKLPADRHSTAGEFARALTATTTTRAVEARAHAGTARSRWRDPVVLGLIAAVIVLAATTAMLARPRGGDQDAFPVRTTITMDAGGPIGTGVLSPDHRSVVYSGVAPSGGGRGLYHRRLDQLTARPIAGTIGAYRSPVFSPDGKWLAFIAGRRQLVKVPVEGGSPIVLAAVPDYGGLDWSPTGEIIIGAGVDEGLQGLFRVNEKGGALVPLTHVNAARKELSHQLPRLLADGRTVAFTIWSGSAEQAELAVAALDDGKTIPLGIRGVKALGVIDGRLIYLTSQSTVMAVGFDQQRLRTVGSPTLVVDDVNVIAGGGSDHDEAFMTNDGGLVYHRGSERKRLVWIDRTGRSTPALDSARQFAHVRFAPNGREAALTIVSGAKRDIWTFDPTAGTVTPLTTTGTSRNPMWSSDGRRILYASTHSGRAAFWWQPADGSGAPELAVVPPHNPWYADLSPDGRNIVFQAISNGTFNLETVSLDTTRQARMLAASATAIEGFGRFSPNGQWVAYTSDESGRFEVYVRPFAGSGGRIQISVAGGRRPMWSRDGKQLFYAEGDRIISASVGFAPGPTVMSRTTLFSGRFEDEFDVSPDGTRFLMIQAEPMGLSLVVIPHWRTELHRLTAGDAR